MIGEVPHTGAEFEEGEGQRDQAGLKKSVASLKSHTWDSAALPPHRYSIPPAQACCPGWYSHFHSNQWFCHRDTILTPGGL